MMNWETIEKALEMEFSLHDVGHIMDILNEYRKVEIKYIDDEDGFINFLKDRNNKGQE